MEGKSDETRKIQTKFPVPTTLITQRICGFESIDFWAKQTRNKRQERKKDRETGTFCKNKEKQGEEIIRNREDGKEREGKLGCQ